RLKSRNSTFSDGPGAHLTSRGKRKRNLHRFLHSNRLRNYTSFADAIPLNVPLVEGNVMVRQQQQPA
ncbi:MAG: hypothetical protein O9256_02070, partial [Rhizobiaceae bacterium]|nr:hypothetical protein [Rhizobiaceae bacterium]